MWSRENLPRCISLAAANYLKDKGRDPNIVFLGTDGRHRVTVACPWDGILIGTLYDFDSVYDPFSEVAGGVPKADVVFRDDRGVPSGFACIQCSVVPDASTRGLADELTGPELTMRTDLLALCALSSASSIAGDSKRALDILERSVPYNIDWSDWSAVEPYLDTIQGNMSRLFIDMADAQSPVLLQCVWRTRGDGPFLADDAMDVFVWTDFALSDLFVNPSRPTVSGPSKAARCAVREYLLVTSVLRGERPDVGEVFDLTDYGLPAGKGKEMMFNGRITNRCMHSDRLTFPSIARNEVAFLASNGFKDMVMPERRLDMALYETLDDILGDGKKR